MLVHGPLTLTLMLQVLNKHLRLSQIAQGPEAIQSIEYRNIAPLYCDEEMRVCIKNKKRTDTGNSWDVWIEGPTGGMAVKAVAHTAVRSAGAVFANRAEDSTPSESAEGTTSANLPDVQTVALQAQDRLHALDQEDSGKEQLSQVSREERRKLWRQGQRTEPDNSQTETPKPIQEYSEFSRKWRKQWVGKSLRYLYLNQPSPLLNKAEVPRLPLPSSQPTAPAQSSQAKPKSSLKNKVEYSKKWRKQWVGKSLPYLYLWETSPLTNRAVVPRESAQTDAAKAPTSASKALEKPMPRNTLEPAAPEPHVALPSLRERQRAGLMRASLPSVSGLADTTSTSDTARPLNIRSIKTDGPEEVLPLSNMQSETGVKKLSSAREREERVKKSLTIKKIEGVRIRKTDIDLKETERRRAHDKRVNGVNGGEGRRGQRNDVLSVLQAANASKET